MTITPTTEILQAIVDQTTITNVNTSDFDDEEMISHDLEIGELSAFQI